MTGRRRILRDVRRLSGAAVVGAGGGGLSACGGSHKAISSGPHRFRATPLVKRLTAVAKSTARSLGDGSVKTALVYGPDSRYALVKASSGDLVQKTVRERKGFYLIVLHGHFVCNSCSGPAGTKP